MKKLGIILILLLIFSASCDRSLNALDPTDSDVVIRFLGKDTGENESSEFLFYNGSQAPVYFMGYGPEGPIYSIEVQSDTGWVNSSPGWCGTGLVLHELAPGSSFKFNAYLNDNYSDWRVGIWLYDRIGDIDRLVCSNAVQF